MSDAIVDYYLKQAGSGVGPVFEGAPYQRGHGIGNFFSSLFKRVFPFIKSGAKVVGKEALNAGLGFLSDTIAKQKPVDESMKSRLKEAGRNLMTRAEQQLGSGYKNRKRKAKHQSVPDLKRKRIILKKRDIFS
jgi:hypothetical protein